MSFLVVSCFINVSEAQPGASLCGLSAMALTFIIPSREIGHSSSDVLLVTEGDRRRRIVIMIKQRIFVVEDLNFPEELDSVSGLELTSNTL